MAFPLDAKYLHDFPVIQGDMHMMIFLAVSIPVLN